MLRFEVYTPGDVVPEVEARLLNRQGDTMFTLAVRPASPGEPFQVELAPAFLPPGEYLVELSASTADHEATELVPFRLGA